MNCIDYRRLITSDPAHRGAEVASHRLACQPCAAYTQRMLDLDRNLRDAMMIDAPEGLESRVMLAATGESRSRWRWYSIAAGAVAGLAVSFGLLTGNDTQSGQSLGDSIVAHIVHEPELLVPAVEVIAKPQLASVLERAGVQLTGDPGAVTYAGLCPFRGHYVPHMVVQSESGPITVLVLPDEKIHGPITIDKDGFRGTIVPVKGGSIAVVGGEDEDEATESVKQRFMNLVEWQI